MIQLNRYIEHTLLRADATIDQIITLCQEAVRHQFAAVCVNPAYVSLAAHLLTGTKVKTSTVIGFPLGATLTKVKAYEAATAVQNKAEELDMVIPIGAVKAGQWEAVLADIRAVVAAAEGNLVKVIVETSLLTDEEKRRVCDVVLQSGAHYIKTSTGFAAGGATVADVALFKTIIGDTSRCGIKASGGIKTAEQAYELIQAGATRLGTSSGVALVTAP
ncbi:MAG: deoxyribose-phosphate aldolase [Negativicutes bacterium]|nr:deoxyribose-phosphate aldolase [Negativicutes bacterium]